jgi:hypothetical protein
VSDNVVVGPEAPDLSLLRFPAVAVLALER